MTEHQKLDQKDSHETEQAEYVALGAAAMFELEVKVLGIYI